MQWDRLKNCVDCRNEETWRADNGVVGRVWLGEVEACIVRQPMEPLR